MGESPSSRLLGRDVKTNRPAGTTPGLLAPVERDARREDGDDEDGFDLDDGDAVVIDEALIPE